MDNSKEILRIKNYVEKNYNLDVKDVEKVKNSYKIFIKDGGYCLKVIRYEFFYFYFILFVMKYLQRKGFNDILEFILNKDKKDYGVLDGNYVYLIKWILLRVSNYDNLIELVKVVVEFGKLY